MAIYWTSNNIPGYSSHSNGNWSDFMNAYARHPYDTNADANTLPDVSGSASITAPYSGTYELCGASDNYGSISLGGSSQNVNGFKHSGKCTSRYYSQGDNISISWSFGNSPGGSSFNGNPSAISIRLTGPDAPSPPTASLSVSPTAIIRGQCTTLTWSSSGGTSFSLTDVSNPGSGGSDTVCPQNTKSYTYTVSNEGGSRSSTKEVTVYIPPTINVTADVDSLILGGSTTIRWSHTGDADSVSWTSGGLTNTNLNSTAVVSPTVKTSYCAVASGLGGVSPENCATVTVYEPPRIETFDVPTSIAYGQGSYNVEYDTLYANTDLKLEIFNGGYTTGPNEGTSFLHETIALTTAATAEAGETTLGRAQGIIPINPQWDNFGPRTITVRLSGTGDGGSFVDEIPIPVIIDETPENINIPESNELLKDADPVITPDSEILSETYYIEGIDIPVEIKASDPILVEINQDDNWTKIRRI